MKPIKSHYMSLLLAVFLAAGLLSGCAGKTGSAQTAGMEGMEMASLEGAPQEIQDAPQVVKQSYQFAVANPEIMQQFPCYCGCGKMGHTSNYSCYVQETDSSGKVAYDNHALGCSICVDITQDVMRLLKEKKPIPEIQAYVDETYAQYGPSNMSQTGSAYPSSSGQAHEAAQGNAQAVCSRSPEGGSTCGEK